MKGSLNDRLSVIAEVFWRFLLLGFTSFGGPAAHIGYFRRTFVDERQWLDDDHFGRLVALSQFLPGPGSSQLGFAIGLHRAGLAGATMAFIGFTLPSFLIMLGIAVAGDSGASFSWTQGVIHGLKLLAVVVVADACVSMYGSFCTSKAMAAIAIVAAVVLLVVSGIAAQVGVLLLAATAGLLLGTDTAHSTGTIRRPAWMPLILFVGLALALAIPTDLFMRDDFFMRDIAADFYLAGSLVFGGGHVVLPLLETLVADELGQETFLTGYAAAQAVPGPMFTLASYLGAELGGSAPVLGAVVATLAIFLPGFLLLLAFHDAWHSLTSHARVAGVAAGINAAVVGLLMAALYDPVFTSGIQRAEDMALVIVGLFALRVLRINIALLVAIFAGAGFILAV